MKRSSMYAGKLTVCLLMLSLIGLLSSCEHLEDLFDPPKKERQESADVVYAWYQLIVRIQLHQTPSTPAPMNFRNFGYFGVGLYESVRPGIKGAKSLSSQLYQMPAMPEPEEDGGYVWAASANAALASMVKQFLVGLNDADLARIDSMENAYTELFRSKFSDADLTRSQAFGRDIANSIYEWAATDNFNLSNQGYVPPKFPGSWEPTPPAFANPFGPFIKDTRPFLEFSLTATTPDIPFSYSEEASSEFYQAAKEVYDISESLTAQQKAIADSWADIGGVGVGLAGGGRIISIVTEILKSKKEKLGRAAEIYAKTGIALKDGLYLAFKDKYTYNLIRPVTYINQQIDPAWLPYLTTPPYPEYPSGLSGIYSPVFQVLIREFGDIPVVDKAYAWRGVAPKYYDNISEMDEEAATSRVYGGLHYQFTMDITREMGAKLGDQAANLSLIPNK